MWGENTPGETSDASSNVVWGPSSCTAALGCLVLGNNAAAVGGLSSPEQSATLWNGTRWTAFPAPRATTISPVAPAQLNGVSCTATICIAVGSTDAGPVRTLIERYR